MVYHIVDHVVDHVEETHTESHKKMPPRRRYNERRVRVHIMSKFWHVPS